MNLSLAPAATLAVARRRPRFAGLVWGELFKLVRLRIVWVLVALETLFILGALVLLAMSPDTKSALSDNALGAFHNLLQGDLSLARIFTGIAVLILAAHVVGLEYQQGTIRILLGRGVGRLQLLGAKVLALAVITLALLAAELALEAIVAWMLVSALDGSAWRALNAEFWADARFYLLGVLVSIGATLLLGVVASVVGRSLSFGLAVALSWFPVDNLVTIPLNLAVRLTHSDFWSTVSTCLLGPLLNRLSGYLAPAWHLTVRGPSGPTVATMHDDGFGIQPLAPVTAAHALAVIGVYGLVFAVTAVVLTWRRDVLE